MLGFTKTDKYTELFIKENTVSYDIQKCKEYATKIINNPSDVLRENINHTKKLETNTHQLSFDWLDKHYGTMPLALFSECFESRCALCRNFCDQREIMEEEILKLELPSNLIYTTYMCGYFFQDIVILTKLISEKKITHLTLNITDATVDYTSYITSEHNPRIGETNGLYNTVTNDKKHQQQYMMLMTYRLLKLIEYFESFGIELTFRIYDDIKQYYDQCILDSSYKSDIYVGIDYIETCMQDTTIFKAFSVMSTKENGYICSSHTDGFGSTNIATMIVTNNNVNDMIVQLIDATQCVNKNNPSKHIVSRNKLELDDKNIQNIIIDNIEYVRDDTMHTIFLEPTMRNLDEYLNEVCFVSKKEYEKALEIITENEKIIIDITKKLWKSLFYNYKSIIENSHNDQINFTNNTTFSHVRPSVVLENSSDEIKLSNKSILISIVVGALIGLGTLYFL